MTLKVKNKQIKNAKTNEKRERDLKEFKVIFEDGK